MVIQYAVCDVDPPYHITFPHTLIIYNPGLFTFSIKALIHKSEYLLQRNNNYKEEITGVNEYYYVITLL